MPLPRLKRRRLEFESLEPRCLLAADLFSNGGIAEGWFGEWQAYRELPNARADVPPSADRWIVELADEAASSFEEAAGLLAQAGATSVAGLGMAGVVVVGAPDESGADFLADLSFVRSYRQDAAIDGAAFANDPLYATQQYGLRNLGGPFTVADADIDADLAWDITTGSSDVVVAVLDSGIDYTHPDLAGNIWSASNTILGPDAATPISNGWDFVNDDADPIDDHGHGTHVAGIVGAEGDNGIGVAGVNWDVSLLPIKVLNENNSGSVSSAVAAINYTTFLRTQHDVNIRVINASWGGVGVADPMLEAAIETAGDAGILFVTAAGNGDVFGRGQDLDTQPFFPASFDLDNILTVGATDASDNPTRFTNFGVSVDISAPGQSIWSTELRVDTSQQTFAPRSGTSMATPHAAGVAALLWAAAPNATLEEVQQALLDGGDPLESLQGLNATGARLNALGALRSLPPQAEVTSADPVETIGGATYQFTVSLRNPGDGVLDADTIGDGDFFVRNADASVVLPATLVSATPSTDQPQYTGLVYQIAAPNGEWGIADAGRYEIVLAAEELADNRGQASIQKAVGAFEVDFAGVNVFRPTTFEDSPLASLTPGGPIVAQNGEVTLRSIIQSGLRDNAPVTILLDAGTYPLTVTGSDGNQGSTGDFDIRKNVTIIGSGAGETVIDAGGEDGVRERVFHVVDSDASLTLERLTVTGGYLPGRNSGAAVSNAGELTIRDSVIRDNAAPFEEGGAIRNSGTLTIQRSQLLRNSAITGGAISNVGDATVVESTIDGNAASNSTYTTLLEHNGSNNPETEGWLPEFGSAAVTADAAIGSSEPAWSINDSGTEVGDYGGYEFSLSPEQLESLNTDGWRLTVRMSVLNNLNGAGASTTVFNDGANDWVMSFGRSGQDTTVRLQAPGGTSTAILGPMATVTGAGFNTYQLEYDPESQSADLWVNGVRLIESFDTPRAFAGSSVSFGSKASRDTGEGLYSLVRLEQRVPANGGGVHNTGTLTVDRSTVSNNTSDVDGGGLWNAGAATLTNATVSGNSTQQHGGGIYNQDGDVSLEGSTVVENSSSVQQVLAFASEEFRINSVTTNTQQLPVLDINSSGESLVAWESGQPGTVNLDVFVQRYAADGSSVDQFQVNRANAAERLRPGVAITEEGVDLIAFQAWNGDSDGWGLLGRFYDRTGSFTDEILLNSPTSGAQTQPVVESVGDNFWVAYDSTASSRDVLLRQFNSAGTALTGSMRVNSRTSGDQFAARTTSWGDGGFAVSWYDSTGGYVTIFDASGSIISADVQVTTVSGSYVDLLARPDSLLATWTEPGVGVLGRRLDRQGVAIGDPFTIATAVEPGFRTDVTALPDGGYAATWSSNEFGATDYEIYLQQFDLNDASIGDPIAINETVDGRQLNQRIGTDSNGNGLVVWQGAGSGDSEGIFARRVAFSTAPGAGIFHAAGAFEVENSVIAGNLSAAGNSDVSGDFTSMGGNLVGNAVGSTGFGQNSDQAGDVGAPLDPSLGPLADNGGPTFTHRLLPGSPLIDAATGGEATDQRGVSRMVDGDGDGNAAPDIGAVELFYGSISGRKFSDVDQDGVQDPGEPGIANWTLYLDLNENGRLDTNEPSTLTDANGDYSFDLVEPGTYLVSEIEQAGWVRTFTPTSFADEVKQDEVDYSEATVDGLAGVQNIAVSPDGLHLYAVNNDSLSDDSVAAFRINPDNDKLEYLGKVVVPDLEGDSQLVVSSDGSNVFATGAANGKVVRLHRNTVTGLLNSPQSFDTAPNPRDVAASPDGRNFYTLGGDSTNGLNIYFFNEAASQWIPLPPVDITGEALAITPDGRWLYAANGAGVTPYSRNVQAGGLLTQAGASLAVPSGVIDIVVSPEGRHAYLLSGDGAIEVHEINPATGGLTFIESLADGTPDSDGVLVPSLADADSFALSPSGDRLYVTSDAAITFDDSLFVFRRDDASGRLAFDDQLSQFSNDGAGAFLLSLGDPKGVAVGADGDSLYVAAQDSTGKDVISRYRRDGRGRDSKVIVVGGDATADFSSFAAPGEIRGTVFSDLNDNGVRDIGEQPLVGGTVYLDLDQSGNQSSGDLITTTDEAGDYRFTELQAPNRYVVRFAAGSGQTVTSPPVSDASQWTVDITPQEVFGGADFLVNTSLTGQQGNSTISGFLFRDLNGDGEFQPGSETPLAGQRVYLDLNNNGRFDPGAEAPFSTTTSSTGTYTFDGLTAAEFVVRVDLDAGDRVTGPLGNQFTAQSLPTGANPLSLQAIDLDGENGLDIVSVDSSSDQVSVWLRQANGLYGDRTTYTVGALPTDVTAGHFDNDGNIDLAVVHASFSFVVFLRGNGDGTFQPFAASPQISLPSGFTSIEAANFDGIGLDDLVVTVDVGGNTPSKPDTATLLLNNNLATPSFTKQPSIDLGDGAPLSLTVGQLTGDSLPDVVVASLESSEVNVLTNTGGSLSLTHTQATPIGPSSLTIADVNDDGELDVIGTAISANRVFTLFGDGNGGFTGTQETPVGLGPRSIEVVDVDSDGDLDYVVGNTLDNNVVVLRNENGIFSPPENTGLASFSQLVASGVKRVIAADLDGNGAIDIAAVRGSSTDGSLGILSNSQAEGSHRVVLNGANTVVGRNFGLAAVRPGDYDGSGTVDLDDYSVWAENFGETDASGDGNGDRVVNAADFTIWRDLLPASQPNTNASQIVAAEDSTETIGSTESTPLRAAASSDSSSLDAYFEWIGVSEASSRSATPPTQAASVATSSTDTALLLLLEQTTHQGSLPSMSESRSSLKALSATLNDDHTTKTDLRLNLSSISDQSVKHLRPHR